MIRRPMPAVALALALALGACQTPEPKAPPTAIERSIAEIEHSRDYVDVGRFSGVIVDLRYGTTDNFTHGNLYGPFRRAFLHRVAAAKLQRAVELLRQEHPGYRLRIYDALRPRSVQYKLWDVVKGTTNEQYVADPARGSVHNYGFALDLTVDDASGHPLDMGSPFDDFNERAQPQLEAGMLQKGVLTRQQLANRLVLRGVMERAGFIQLPHEWWHYDALPIDQLKAGYTIVE